MLFIASGKVVPKQVGALTEPILRQVIDSFLAVIAQAVPVWADEGIVRQGEMKKLSGISKRQQQRNKNRHNLPWLSYGLIGLGGLLLIGVFLLSVNQAGAQSVNAPRVGAPLNDFSLTDIQGQKVSLSDYKGKVVLVNAWATWCPPCKAEMPDINAFYQAHQKDGFMVLAVNAGDPQTSAADFAQSKGLAFPVLLDPDLRLLDGMGIHDFPTSIVVGRDGRVKHIQVGMFTPQALDAVVTPLLSQ